MRILLIQPAPLGLDGRVARPWRAIMPGLTLPYLAAMVPPGDEVRVVDDNLVEVDVQAPVDLVGLTAMTQHAPRAYQLADAFRARGVPVVMGGFHASALPDEAQAHVDAVVQGEAEELWPLVIEDARAKRLKPRYVADAQPSLDHLPVPRYDLVPRSGYLLSHMPVQTTRGCPYACDYCAVTKFYGRSYRHRPVAGVLDDVRASGGKRIFFVDDNIGVDKPYATELFEALLPMGLPWFGQANMGMAKDEGLLRLAARSGCRALYLGMESVRQDTLDKARKGCNRVEDFAEALGAFRRAGIMPITSVMFGFDTDDPSVFEETVAFLRKNAVGIAFFYILGPLPGTPLYDKLKGEGRIREGDWSRYAPGNVLFEPKGMTGARLKEGYDKAFLDFYSLPSIAGRFLCHRQPDLARNLLLNLFLHWQIHWGRHPLGG